MGWWKWGKSAVSCQQSVVKCWFRWLSGNAKNRCVLDGDSRFRCVRGVSANCLSRIRRQSRNGSHHRELWNRSKDDAREGTSWLRRRSRSSRRANRRLVRAYENCCTSYPIPLNVVVYRDGHRLKISPRQMIWDWKFVADGQRIAISFARFTGTRQA